jgi:hypothetical protein
LAALTATQPTAAGVAWTPGTLSTSDTINATQLGQLGAYLFVNNNTGGAGSVTVSDASKTPAGNSATTTPNSIANTTSEVMFISPKAADPNTGLVTLTNSPTGMTYVLLPIG